MAQKIIINKNTGSIISVYTNEIENLIEKITNKSDISIKRVSNINFNNSNKKWEAIDVLDNNIINSSDTKKKAYEDEANWANENLKTLSEKHF